MKSQAKFLLALPLLLVAGAGTSFATITGDPATDGGWTSEGNSATTDLLFQTGSFSANIYSTTFALSAGSPLLGTLGTSDGWSAGDTIVGVGGVFTSTGNSSVTYDTMNGTVTTRFVVKYGTSAETWSAGSANNAALALGGTGAVELGTSTEVLSPTSGLQTPSNTPEEQTGPSSTATISTDVGQIITSWSGNTPNTIVGFEEFLDLTLLKTQNPTENVALGDHFILDLQQKSGVLQDSLGTLSASPVPETTTMFAGALLLLPFCAGALRMLLKKTASRHA